MCFRIISIICLIFSCFSDIRAGQILAPACPRPPIGSAVTDPLSLHAERGVLNIEFAFRSYIDVYGLRLFCYISGEQMQSPTVRLKPGEELRLSLKNEVPAARTSPGVHRHGQGLCGGGPMTPSTTNLHFHGLPIPPKCHQDEVLYTTVQPAGPAFEYRFKIPASARPGLYWYHPHPHGFSQYQVMGGASGALIVEGIEREKPEVAGLPERVLVLRDQAVPGLSEADEDSGPGKDVSLNFVPVMFPLYQPATMTVPPVQREFWRVLNAGADTYFDLEVRYGSTIQDVSEAQPLQLIAMDGIPIGRAAGEPTTTHILLPPGARAEFLITTPPANKVGQLVTRAYLSGPDGQNMPFRVIANIASARDAKSPATLPEGPAEASHAFRGLESLIPARTRKLFFSEVHKDPNDPNSPTDYFITLDGKLPKVFDMNFTQPDIVVQQGTVEDWVVENRAREAHAFHIHQLHFQVLERDRKPAAESMLRDTVDIAFWDGKSQYPSVKLRMDFRDPAIVGTFLYHCHILEHEDGGMMGSIRVDAARIH